MGRDGEKTKKKRKGKEGKREGGTGVMYHLQCTTSLMMDISSLPQKTAT